MTLTLSSVIVNARESSAAATLLSPRLSPGARGQRVRGSLGHPAASVLSSVRRAVSASCIIDSRFRFLSYGRLSALLFCRVSRFAI